MAPGVANCYGDKVTGFTAVGCDRVTFTCTYEYVTQSRCRVKLPNNSEIFNQCQYAKDADRIADMGSDIAYPKTLDSLHRHFINVYTCDAVDTNNCTLSNQSPLGYPDPVTFRLTNSDFLSQAIEANPFQVTSGLLPFPTAIISQFNYLSDKSVRGAQVFDGNLFSNQPVTILTLLPEATRDTNDLRITNTPVNVTITPLNAQAQPLINGRILTYSDIRSRVLYTTKNDYDDGCGAQIACKTLPACNGIYGCDGFSIPTSQLLALSPANGYAIVVNYRIGFARPDGSAPNARRLLSHNELAFDKPMRALLQTSQTTSYENTVSFQFSVSVNGTNVAIGTPQINVNIQQNVMNTLKDIKPVFYMTVITHWSALIIIYAVISQVSKESSRK